jgi:hypothetical protein
MTTRDVLEFERRTLDELTIEDDRSFRHIELYGDLKEVLRRDGYSFRILPEGGNASWDRALFLNLAYWGASEGGDVLTDERVPADVVAHVAWHRLAAKALGGSPGERPSVEGLFLGEAIASAFDLYLVGRVLGHAPSSSFLRTQVPAIAEVAEGAGVAEVDFALLLQGLAAGPEDAFSSLRELLSDATAALFACEDAESALAVLTSLESRRFGALLHHYELANWVLYARAHGSDAPSPKARAVDRSLREASDPLAWLTNAWVRPALV